MTLLAKHQEIKILNEGLSVTLKDVICECGIGETLGSNPEAHGPRVGGEAHEGSGGDAALAAEPRPLPLEGAVSCGGRAGRREPSSPWGRREEISAS